MASRKSPFARAATQYIVIQPGLMNAAISRIDAAAGSVFILEANTGRLGIGVLNAPRRGLKTIRS